jgi:HYR domain/Thrombospondin type 3 repeat
VNPQSKSAVWVVLCAFCLTAGANAQFRVYVKHDATGANDGTSWANAFTDLNAALDRQYNGSASEFWVARGTYVPRPPSGGQSGFQLSFLTSLHGGFAGHEMSLEQRDLNNNLTILSGDMLGNDAPNFVGFEDNVEFLLSSEAATVTGVVLRGSRLKAARTNTHGEPPPPSVFRDCVFLDHRGLGVETYSNARLESCRFARIGGAAISSSVSTTLPRYGTIYGVGASRCIFLRCGMLESSPALHFTDKGAGGFWHCLFAHNDFGVVSSETTRSVEIDSSILWRNGPLPVRGSGRLVLHSNLVEGLREPASPTWVFSDLMDGDPLFVDALGADGLPGSGDEDFRLRDGSICIDRAGLDRTVAGCADDLGPYESPYFRDCDGNGLADRCEIAQNRGLDADNNNRLDRCDPYRRDCNGNGVYDVCEADADGDGTPDECEPLYLLNCPADATVFASGSGGAYAVFAPPTAHGGVGSVAVTTSVSPGALLPLGENVVVVQAADAAGKTAECRFRIRVLSPEPDPAREPDPVPVDEEPTNSDMPADCGACGAVPGVTLMIGLAGMSMLRRVGSRRMARILALLPLAILPNVGPRGLAADCNQNGIPDDQESTFVEGRIFVDAAASGDNTGDSWDNAYTDLHAGLCAARDWVTRFSSPATVFVARGVFRPSSQAVHDRMRSFSVPPRTTVSGGWSRGSAGVWQQNPDATPTVLDGDLLHNNGFGFFNTSDDSIHVLTCDRDPNIRLDGLNIRHGNADGAGDDGRGGGVFGPLADITMTRCVLTYNQAATAGGAVSVRGLSASRCVFSVNEAAGGSAIHVVDFAMRDCILYRNGIQRAGLAIRMEHNTNESTLDHCTLFQNAGLVSPSQTFDRVTANSCIAWGNGPQYPIGFRCYSCDIDIARSGDFLSYIAEPRLVDPDGADNIPGTPDDDFRLAADSPCIDRDAPSFPEADFAGNPRPQHCYADTGAFESSSFRGEDCDGNGKSDRCELDIDDRRDVNRNLRLDRCEPVNCDLVDTDDDGISDWSEWDSDGDGVPDDRDACPLDYLRSRFCAGPPDRQDSDGDGVPDNFDNCPTVSNGDQADIDKDGVGDACAPLAFVSCPADLTVAAQGPGGALLAIAVPATKGGAGAVTVTLNAPADGRFPVGTTPVLIRAVDSSGALAECAFRVTVSAP